MHKVLKAFPCSFDGIKSETLAPGDERDFGSMAEGLKKAGLIGELNDASSLRQDGPTIAEYVGAGYPATGYPPQGYASRSTAKEIAAAVKAEAKAKADAEKAAVEEAARAAKAAEEQKAKEAAEAERVKARETLIADLGKLSDEDLAKIVIDEKIAVDEDDDKNAIIGKIADARLGAQG
jgi:hypothetical protein